MERWRLIVDPDLPGVENMARDEVLLTGLDDGAWDMPVLRLYGWAEPTISIGYAQDPGALSGVGLPVVRRITGGRAVIHDDEVTYSVSAPLSHPLFKEGITGSYNIISGCIVAALEDIGVHATLSRPKAGRGPAGHREACFYTPSRSEVLVEEGKLVGSAQRRFKRAFLQHGSILFGVDRPTHDRVFGPGVAEKMACISAFSRAGRDEFRKALIKAFSSTLGCCFVENGLSPAERIEAASLIQKRYAAAGWNAVRAGT